MSQPNEAPDIEAAHGAPDPEAIMYHQLDASGAGIAEHISVVSTGGAEDLDDTGQQTIGARSHVHGLDRQPQGIDADRRSHSRSQAPQAAASCVGQITLMATEPRRSSSRIAAASVGRPASCTATNPSPPMGDEDARSCAACVPAAAAPLPARSFSQRRTKLALRPLDSATAAIDTPVWRQA